MCCTSVLVVLMLIVILRTPVWCIVAILTLWRLVLLRINRASVAGLLSVAWSTSIGALVLIRWWCAILVVAPVLRLLGLSWCGRPIILTRWRVVLMLPAITALLVLAVSSLLMLIVAAVLARGWGSVRIVAWCG